MTDMQLVAYVLAKLAGNVTAQSPGEILEEAKEYFGELRNIKVVPKEIQELTEYLYKSYPSKRCGGKPVQKTTKDRDKIQRLLMAGEPECIKMQFELGIEQMGDYVKDLRRFLNELPDISAVKSAASFDNIRKQRAEKYK